MENEREILTHPLIDGMNVWKTVKGVWSWRFWKVKK